MLCHSFSSIIILTAALCATLTSAIPSPQTTAGEVQGALRVFEREYLDVPEKNKKKHTSDSPVFYLKPGESYCGPKYRDVDYVACLDESWLSPKQLNNCERFVKVYNPKTDITLQIQALDMCGGPGTGFGQNDIYLSKKAFMRLSGKDEAAKNLDMGNLGTPVTWSFVQESCEGCWKGIEGKDDKHQIDSCSGPDALGFPRCGRKQGNERIFSPSPLKEVCRKDYVCPA